MLLAFLSEMPKGGGSSSPCATAHYRRDVLFVEFMDLINGKTQREKRGNNASSARAKNQVELLGKRRLCQAFQLLQNPQRVKAFRPSAIQRKNATW